MLSPQAGSGSQHTHMLVAQCTTVHVQPRCNTNGAPSMIKSLVCMPVRAVGVQRFMLSCSMAAANRLRSPCRSRISKFARTGFVLGSIGKGSKYLVIYSFISLTGYMTYVLELLISHLQLCSPEGPMPNI